MKCTLSNIAMFAAGAVLGSVVTWRMLKTKYERIAQEEIDSVKEVFSRKYTGDQQGKIEVEKDSEEIAEYVNRLSCEGYANHSDIEKKEVPSVDRPYVIPPEDFGELDGYETVSLTYYADKVLTDEWGEVIEDIDELVGEDSLTHFGEYEKDSVFVRNDLLQVDYEILLDLSTYADTVSGA